VHQGGAGTGLTAGLCAVPQLVLPQLPDQVTNADNLAAAGVARMLPPGQLDPTALRRAAGDLLTEPAHRAAAGRLRAEMLAQPSPAEVVDPLVELARRGVPDTAAPARPGPGAAQTFGMSYLDYLAARDGAARAG
jgi:UDP:flavonoid glycosyltransferase YjiC (YdhE family)